MNAAKGIVIAAIVLLVAAFFGSILYYLNPQEPAGLTCNDVRTGDTVVNIEQSELYPAFAVVVDLNAETIALESMRDGSTTQYTCAEFAREGWSKAVMK